MKKRRKYKKPEKENDKEAIIAVAAAVLVLFSALIDPWISFALAAVMVIAFILYKVVSQED